MPSSSLHRTIGLKEAVFILVGFIVGATIFVLPGTLAVEAGPAVFLAYILAGVPAVFACFVMAQVGGAFPTSGASYIIISRVLSPYLGFIYLSVMVSLVAIVIPLIAFGFANYLQHFIVGADVTITSVIITLFFITTNCMGMNLSASIQSIMVMFFLLALIVFGVGGVMQGDAQLIQPFFPKGFPPVVLAAITAYFSYAGVFIIAEIAGEVKNPGKNIPRSIFISFVVIVFIYTLVPLAMVMTMPWDSLAGTKMAVVTASEIFLPSWVVNIIAIGALLAAATSINGLLMSVSRDFFQGARVNLFPNYFAKIDDKTGVPVRAVIFAGILALTGIFVGGTITEYAQTAVLGIMLVQILVGAAVLRLPKILPEVYEQAKFRLSKRSLVYYCWGFVLFSVGFLIYLGIYSPISLAVGILYLLITSLYFKLRMRSVKLNLEA